MELSKFRINLKDQRLIIFIILLGFLAVALYMNFRSKTDAASQQSVANKNKYANQETDTYFDIAILQSLQDVNVSSKRDLFRYYQAPPPVQQTPPLPPDVINKPVDPPPRIDSNSAQSQGQEPPSMMNIRIFGILKRGGKDMFAFLSDGKEVYVVGKNDIFANQFKVAYIDDEKIEISALKGNFKKTLTISGGN